MDSTDGCIIECMVEGWKLADRHEGSLAAYTTRPGLHHRGFGSMPALRPLPLVCACSVLRVRRRTCEESGNDAILIQEPVSKDSDTSLYSCGALHKSITAIYRLPKTTVPTNLPLSDLKSSLYEKRNNTDSPETMSSFPIVSLLASYLTPLPRTSHSICARTAPHSRR